MALPSPVSLCLSNIKYQVLGIQLEQHKPQACRIKYKVFTPGPGMASIPANANGSAVVRVIKGSGPGLSQERRTRKGDCFLPPIKQCRSSGGGYPRKQEPCGLLGIHGSRWQVTHTAPRPTASAIHLHISPLTSASTPREHENTCAHLPQPTCTGNSGAISLAPAGNPWTTGDCVPG